MNSSTSNNLSAATLAEGSALQGTFELSCDKIHVIVNSTSTESIGCLFVQFSSDGSTVSQTVKQLFVTSYHRNKDFVCAMRDSYFRVRFEAINIHDTRSPAVANSFANLTVTTSKEQSRCCSRGGDHVLGERVLTLRGRTTVSNGSSGVIGNGLTLDTVATFPVLTAGALVRILNSATTNDAAGLCARTFMVTGLDADMNEQIWCGDIVSSNTNDGASQSSPVSFLAINDVRIVSFGAAGKAEVGSTLQVQMSLNGWCTVAQLDDSTFFQYRTLAYTVPNGYTARVRNMRFTTTDRNAVNILRVHCLQKQSRVPLHVYRTPSAPKKAVTVRPSRVLPAGTLVVAECSSTGSTSSVAAEVNLAISGVAPTTTPNLRTPLLSASDLYVAESYTEDTQLSLTGFTVTNTANSTARVVMTLSDASAGAIAGSAASTNTVGTVTTGTLAAGAGSWTMDTSTGIWQATATNSALNTLLGTLVFTPAANYNSSFRIDISVDTNDNGPTDVVYGTKLVTGVAVNDPPAATNLSAAETYTETQALALTPIVVSDVDNAAVTVTLSFAANASAGTINTPTVNSTVPTFSVGVWSATGPVADLNSILGQLTFTSALGYYSSFNISTSVSDGSLSVTGTKAMTGIPLNTPPSATNLSAAETYKRSALSLTAIVVTDPDAGNMITATLTLSNTSAGTLTTVAAGSPQVTPTFSSGVWTAVGTLSAVNACLAIVQFVPTSGFASNFSISTSVSDGIASVTGTKTMTYSAAAETPPALSGAVKLNFTARNPNNTGLLTAGSTVLTLRDLVSALGSTLETTTGYTNPVVQYGLTYNSVLKAPSTMPIIYVNKTNWRLTSALNNIFGSPQQFTIFFRSFTPTSGGNDCFATNNTTTWYQRFAHFLTPTTLYYDQNGFTATTQRLSVSVSDLGTFQTTAIRRSSTERSIWRNGTKLVSGDTGQSVNVTGQYVTIYLASGDPSYFQQLLGYKFALSDSEMATAFAFLEKEWSA